MNKPWRPAAPKQVTEHVRSEGPTFSVVIPTFNRAALLPRAVESVLRQAYRRFEIVIVDDGSTDETQGIVQGFLSPKVRHVRQQNKGLSAARNAGVARARGDFVAFLDDDDEACPEWLLAMANVVVQEGTPVVSCGATWFEPNGTERMRLPGPLGAAFSGLEGLFVAGTFALRRDLFCEVGGFAETLTCSHCTELMLRLAPICHAKQLRVGSVRRALVRIRAREAGERPLSSPQALLGGVRYMLDRHRSRLGLSPSLLASYLSIAGVSSARLGDFAAARRFIGEAVHVRPTALKNYARYVLASIPWFGARVWKVPPSRIDA